MRYSRRNVRLPVFPYSSPPNNSLIEAPSPSADFVLYHLQGKKMCIEAYRIMIEKTKLTNNLDIYEWRYQTQFPIVKTKYVTIQNNIDKQQDYIKLIVFNQHCPLKLNRIYQMTLAQTFYILKQSIIGFQRLYNRFGAFKITQNMIGINQKGFCRVWINQNFAKNQFCKNQFNQFKMICNINQIMEKHCQESRASKKLFNKLRHCKTFLSTLKQINLLILKDKILVPIRYMMNSILKQISPKLQISSNIQNRAIKKQYSIDDQIRQSLNSQRVQKKKLKQNQTKNTKISSKSPQQIKRFKSQDKIKNYNFMKISDGETAYTRNVKCSSTGCYNSPKNNNGEKNNNATLLIPMPNSRPEQSSSFVIDVEDGKGKCAKTSIDKKQLSYSQAVIGLKQSCQKQSMIKYRRLSANINNMESYIYKFHCNIKKSQYEAYQSQFNEILQNKVDEEVAVPRIKIKILQQDEQKYREKHSQNIMKNNGWNENAGNCFMNLRNEMKQSYHQGQQQHLPRMQMKLLKLDSIGKRPVAMSILPEQHQDII